MDQRYSKNNKVHVTLDFNNLTENGLTDLTAALKRSGQEVAEVIASNRKVRKDGILQKKVQLIFDCGQGVTITVAEAGDIIQTKLNSTIVPISNVPTVTAYAKDLASKITNNQPRFDKALARKAAAVIKDTSDIKPASRSLSVRIVESQTALNAAKSNLAAETARLKAANDSITMHQANQNTAKSQLESLKTEEEQLILEIDEFEGQS